MAQNTGAGGVISVYPLAINSHQPCTESVVTPEPPYKYSVLGYKFLSDDEGRHGT